MRIVERPRPGVVAPFTESSTIRGILEDFEGAAGAPLRHKKSVRKTAGPMPKTTAEWDRPAKNRRYKTVGETFANAGKSRAAIDSLRAFAGENGGLDVTVFRRGLVTVHGGDVGRIYDSILRPIIDSGMDRRNCFLRRSRSERPDKEPMPLLIRYERGRVRRRGGQGVVLRAVRQVPALQLYHSACRQPARLHIHRRQDGQLLGRRKIRGRERAGGDTADPDVRGVAAAAYRVPGIRVLRGRDWRVRAVAAGPRPGAAGNRAPRNATTAAIRRRCPRGRGAPLAAKRRAAPGERAYNGRCRGNGGRPDAIFQRGGGAKGAARKVKPSVPRDRLPLPRGMKEQIGGCAEIEEGRTASAGRIGGSPAPPPVRRGGGGRARGPICGSAGGGCVPAENLRPGPGAGKGAGGGGGRSGGCAPPRPRGGGSTGCGCPDVGPDGGI